MLIFSWIAFFACSRATLASYANLAKSATVVHGTTATPKFLNYLYETGPSCVTLSSVTATAGVDVGFGVEQWDVHTIRTVLVYLPKGSRVEDIEATALRSSGRTRLTLSDDIITSSRYVIGVWRGTARPDVIRVSSKMAMNEFVICLVKIYDIPLEEYCQCADPCFKNADIICNVTSVCSETPDPGICRKVNVALNKPAAMSSRYRKSGNASLAVNGLTGTTFSGPGYTDDVTQWNCLQTDLGDSAPYWQVDLGKQYTVSTVVIYRLGTEAGKQRMNNVVITVDGKLCREISSAAMTTINRDEEKMVVACQDPTPEGKYVKVFREGPRDSTVISLCEVQIWECKSGFYGNDCKNTCGTGCDEGQCNKNTGHCSCRPGYHLPMCTTKMDRDDKKIPYYAELVAGVACVIGVFVLATTLFCKNS